MQIGCRNHVTRSRWKRRRWCSLSLHLQFLTMTLSTTCSRHDRVLKDWQHVHGTNVTLLSRFNNEQAEKPTAFYVSELLSSLTATTNWFQQLMSVVIWLLQHVYDKMKKLYTSNNHHDVLWSSLSLHPTIHASLSKQRTVTRDLDYGTAIPSK